MSSSATPQCAAEMKKLLSTRQIERVVVLGANGTMGYGSAALFTTAVPHVTFLARSREKAEAGLAAAIQQVRSPTVASRAEVGDYDHDLETAVEKADLIFETLTEDFGIKQAMFDRVESARRDDSIVATFADAIVRVGSWMRPARAALPTEIDPPGWKKTTLAVVRSP